MSKVTSLYYIATIPSGTSGRARAKWDGGKGWLNIAVGTFTGVTATLNCEIAIQDALLGLIQVPIPGLQNITAAGLYEFEAPEGTFILGPPANLGGGDSITLSYVDLISLR